MRAMAATLWLCWLTALPIFAQENAKEDPLVGDKRLSEWKKLLTDKHPLVRGQTASTLSRVGPSDETIPLLIGALGDRDADGHVRTMAAYGLARIGGRGRPRAHSNAQRR